MTKVFVSYSRKDYKWFLEVKKLLRNEIAHGFIELLSDGDIPPGFDYKSAMETAIGDSDAYVVFLSPDYLKSAFITQTEVPSILERADKEDKWVVPIMARPIDIESLPDSIKKRKLNSKPLSEMNESELRWEMDRIRNALGTFKVITFDPNNPSYVFSPSGNYLHVATSIASGVTGGYNDINYLDNHGWCISVFRSGCYYCLHCNGGQTRFKIQQGVSDIVC